MACSPDLSRTSYSSMTTRSTVLFWMGFWVLFVKFFLQATTILEVDEVILRTFLLFGCVFLALRSAVLVFEGNSSSLSIIGVCLGVLSYIFAGESVLLTTSLILAAAHGVDCQVFLRCWTRAVTAILAYMLFVYGFSHLMGDAVGQIWFDIGGLSSSRSALFFVHPNYCAAVFFAWATAMWCRDDVGSGVKIMVGAIAAGVIIMIAGSRTSAASLCLFFIAVIAFHFWSKHDGGGFARWVPRIAISIPVILALLTLWISAVWFMGPNFSQSASDLLTGRPALWWAQWNYSGLTFFGHRAFEGVLLIRGTYHEIQTVDGLYASFLFNIGIAGFIWLLTLTFRAFRFGGAFEPVSAAAIVVFFIFGFTEWHAINVVICAPIMLLSPGMASKHRREPREF